MVVNDCYLQEGSSRALIWVALCTRCISLTTALEIKYWQPISVHWYNLCESDCT